jgi:cytochrome c
MRSSSGAADTLRQRRLGTLGLFLAGAMVLGLMAGSAEAARSCPAGSPEAAKKLAERAAKVLAAVGRAAAFRQYRDPRGPFVRGDLYVFVVNRHGIIVENVGFPSVIGSGGFDLASRFGAVAARGRGWIRYRWYNPCSRRMEQKMSYLVRVGDLIVGVGAYGSLSV